MKKLNLIVLLITLSNTLLSQYIDYVPQLNGTYIQEYDGTSNYSELTISNATASSKPFSVVITSCYNDAGERVCDTQNKNIFIGGPDEDETFISIDEDNAYSIWFEKNEDAIFCLIGYDFAEPTRYKMDKSNNANTNIEPEINTISAIQLTDKIPSINDKYPDDYQGPEAGMWLRTGTMDDAFYQINASSTLSSQGKNSYEAKNLSDDNPQTAWVEGKDDYGIGEAIELKNGGTKITIYNGHQRDYDSFYNNSRVKKFKVYFDGELVGYVELSDKPGAQLMNLDELNANNSSPDTIKLEIAEIYKGKKWADTAISEIFFVGG